MSLETLPVELKHAVLKAIPDVPTLSALVHASPIYHAVYLGIREECLTAVTLRELYERNVDVKTPYSFIEVSTQDNRDISKSLQLAIKHCYIQTQLSRNWKFTVAECCVLRGLTDLVGWTIDWDQGPERDDQPLRVIKPVICSETDPSVFGMNTRIERPSADYQFDVSLYQVIVFDITKFPTRKPRELPTVELTKVCVDGEGYLDCHFFIGDNWN